MKYHLRPSPHSIMIVPNAEIPIDVAPAKIVPSRVSKVLLRISKNRGNSMPSDSKRFDITNWMSNFVTVWLVPFTGSGALAMSFL